MAALDSKYIAQLAIKAYTGNSDAFAELYAATYPKLYAFAYRYLGTEYAAQEALQQTYVHALKIISTLNNPKIFISWINQICFRICFSMRNRQSESVLGNKSVNVRKHQYTVNQIMKLPFNESQILILRYHDGMNVNEIADLTDMSVRHVKHYKRRGLRRLHTILNPHAQEA